MTRKEVIIMKQYFMKHNHKGAGLVSVIVAIAFVAILGSIIISATLSNYRMKQTNLKTKDSFYHAEKALDEVRIGLQDLVSDAIRRSYLEVMENYSTYDLATKKDLMESVFYETIWTNLAEDPVTHNTYDLSKLTSLLVESTWAGGDLATGYGAILSSNNNQMITYDNEGVVLKNLEVYYRDEKGYVSMLQTDIKLVIPDLQFASNTSLTDISEYSIIADQRLQTAGRGNHQINGNLYTGELSMPGLAAYASTSERLTMDFLNTSNLIVKKQIQLTNGTLRTNNQNIWTNQLINESSILSLQGNCYVKNDLVLQGNDALATISGAYYGYGNHLTNADESSAILVNGQNCTLDLSHTTLLTLAGHGFIGTKSHNYGSLTGGTTGFGNDVFTGESIMVKSNQLIYLVPAECIGVSYSIIDGAKVTGKSKYGRNPLVASTSDGSVSPYAEIATNPGMYDLISDSVISDKLGYPLSRYIKYQDGVPQVEKVFVQTNGETLVYFYMMFKNENAANLFFRDYYSKNMEQIQAYADFYTNGISMNNPAFMLRLQLAGNVMLENGGSTSVLPNTIDDASAKLTASSLNYTKTFDALCSRLVFQYSELSGLHETDLTRDIVFENIVDKTTLKQFMLNYDSYTSGIPKTLTFSNATSSALIIDNEGMDAYHYTGTVDANVHLIIATGDVSVDADYSGLIISDGTVTLSQGVDVTSNQAQVREATNLSREIEGVNWNVIGFFWDGTELINAMGQDEDMIGAVALSDLVVYENWTKK